MTDDESRAPINQPESPSLGSQAADEMFQTVYQEIRRTAHRWMKKEAVGHEMQPTDLVHEVYLRMHGAVEAIDDRQQFLSYAAVAMRRILIEQARRYQAQKHGGDRKRVPLSQVFASGRKTTVDLLELAEILTELEEMGGAYSDIVTLRFVLGRGVEETAQVLQLSPAKIKKDWKFTQAWLRVRLGPEFG